MKTIIFICTGNICRSPMAEGLMRDRLEREGLAGQIRAASAGVWTDDGHLASEYSVLEMAARNIDISGHRSREVTPEIMRDAALVLTMTSRHAEALRAEFPGYAARIHMLAQMVGLDRDVEDPIGGTRADYARAAREIEGLIDAGWPEIVKLLALASPLPPSP